MQNNITVTKVRIFALSACLLRGEHVKVVLRNKFAKLFWFMIDISQLTALISAFRVETEKESISPETVGKILQDITDLLATAIGETEYNIIRFWKETKGSTVSSMTSSSAMSITTATSSCSSWHAAWSTGRPRRSRSPSARPHAPVRVYLPPRITSASRASVRRTAS